MPVEIEVKLRIEHLSPVRDRLKSIGATRVGEVVETNTFLDTTDRALLGMHCGLRLRRSRDLATHAEKLKLTWKGPRGEEAVKQREEIEVAVDKADATIDLLGRLGYARQLEFEKRRESWRVDDCAVELDTLPQLGSFVEVEGPSSESVTAVQAKLGLSSLASVAPTYADLVNRHLSEQHAQHKSLTF
jgi:predicted adenylyl cyclase CyaB